MSRDMILQRKDKTQKMLWREAGKDASSYGRFVHERAVQLGLVPAKSRSREDFSSPESVDRALSGRGVNREGNGVIP